MKATLVIPIFLVSFAIIVVVSGIVAHKLTVKGFNAKKVHGISGLIDGLLGGLILGLLFLSSPEIEGLFLPVDILILMALFGVVGFSYGWGIWSSREKVQKFLEKRRSSS